MPHHRLWLGLALSLSLACAPAPESDPEARADTSDGQEPRGLRVHHPKASPGYVLFTPLSSTSTYLVDNDGLVVHVWDSDLGPGTVYLLDNGNLLRTEREPDVPVFSGGGQNGRIREYTWDGRLVWDFLLANEERLLHHDIERLPSGNVLAISWESKTKEESQRAGRRPGRIPEAGLWPDVVLELEPQPPDGARIVWEWHAWDHLIQNIDERLENFGNPSDHPERIHINGDVEAAQIDPKELEQLKALGYVAEETDEEDIRSDLFHTNAIHYNATLNQIALSSNTFDEIWVIDHSTSTEEAAGSSGGRWGRGGDLLYRWGNPLTYDRARNTPKQRGGQHDIRWIPEGYPGAGHLMVFNNNVGGRGDGSHSSVLEFAPPTDSAGRYIVPEEDPFGPAKAAWTYEAPDKVSFHSSFISGAHRLPNGNTMIASGAQGRFLEVTSDGEIVWEYSNPYSGDLVRGEDSPVAREPRAVFRATRILPDHSALAGKSLKPLDPQPEILPPPVPPGPVEGN